MQIFKQEFLKRRDSVIQLVRFMVVQPMALLPNLTQPMFGDSKPTATF